MNNLIIWLCFIILISGLGLMTGNLLFYIKKFFEWLIYAVIWLFMSLGKWFKKEE